MGKDTERNGGVLSIRYLAFMVPLAKFLFLTGMAYMAPELQTPDGILSKGEESPLEKLSGLTGRDLN